jgi:ketosteroid isomerase-like protein
MNRKVLIQQVRDAELAFADTMARRDFAAFGSFIAEEAVFYAGKQALHGRAQVLAAWKAYFDGAQAPFVWKPDQVEITTGGLIALSSGPVHSAQGKLLGRFNTVWHQEAPGVWRVVFDRGDAP